MLLEKYLNKVRDLPEAEDKEAVQEGMKETLDAWIKNKKKSKKPADVMEPKKEEKKAKKEDTE
jgi:hypothetical protein